MDALAHRKVAAGSPLNPQETHPKFEPAKLSIGLALFGGSLRDNPNSYLRVAMNDSEEVLHSVYNYMAVPLLAALYVLFKVFLADRVWRFLKRASSICFAFSGYVPKYMLIELVRAPIIPFFMFIYLDILLCDAGVHWLFALVPSLFLWLSIGVTYNVYCSMSSLADFFHRYIDDCGESRYRLGEELESVEIPDVGFEYTIDKRERLTARGIHWPVVSFFEVEDSLQSSVLDSPIVYVTSAGFSFVLASESLALDSSPFRSFVFRHEQEHLSDTGLFNKLESETRTAGYLFTCVVASIYFLLVVEQPSLAQVIILTLYIIVVGYNRYITLPIYRESEADNRAFIDFQCNYTPSQVDRLIKVVLFKCAQEQVGYRKQLREESSLSGKVYLLLQLVISRKREKRFEQYKASIEQGCEIQASRFYHKRASIPVETCGVVLGSSALGASSQIGFGGFVLFCLLMGIIVWFWCLVMVFRFEVLAERVFSSECFETAPGESV